MHSRPLGRSGLSIMPLVFGGNVFGWTADEATSFRLLDAFVDAGFNAIDTADVYSRWVDGNSGGESETIIGRWLKNDPQKRDRIVLITKVGSDMGDGHKGLSEKWIMQGAEDSLRRLQTDRIDLYFSHWTDPDTPYEETLGAYSRLMEAGKVGAIGASNHDAAHLSEALAVSRREGLPRYEAVQPEHNLYDRGQFDGALRDLCVEEEIGVITYFSLASGFLTGKYRSPDDFAKSTRGARMKDYLDARGRAILAALDEVGEAKGAKPAEIALAWVMAEPGVSAPIASATSVEQLASLARAAEIELTAEEKQRLDEAGR